MRRFLFVLGFFCLSAPVNAQDDFNLDEAVETCIGCHGEEGIPVDAEYPIIWGQEFFYLYTQLKDYAAGRRDNEIMTPIASEYTRDQLKALAQFFADKPWPAIEAETEENDEEMSERGITGGQCSACHGKWDGDSRIPRLAGQQPGYLLKTMNDFRNEIRMNAPDKISTMKQLDEKTTEALARYLASL